jgi:serine/threonine-protein kinase RsbW
MMTWAFDGGEEAGLEIPARAEYVGLARLFVAVLASSRRLLDEERIDNLKLAVSEACTNAIEAYRDPTGQRVRIRFWEGGDRLEVGVEDSGPGFDLGRLPASFTGPATEPLPSERGLGIPLILSLVDEVSFQPSEQGTAVRLVMRCTPQDQTGGAAGEPGRATGAPGLG